MSPLAMLRAKDSAAAAAAQAGGDAGAPRAAAGRPSVLAACGLEPHDIAAIKRIALTAPRWEDVVSCSFAVRAYAAQLPEGHPFKAWAAARHSKHHLPASLMAAIGLARVNGGRGGRLVAHDQDPTGRERLRYEPTAPGTLRPEAAGMAESWDDASVNFIFWCEIGGELRCGRFQLLLGVDQATDYITGFAFVARERDSYRAEDAVARAMWPTWSAHGAPVSAVLERGVWEAERATEFLTAAGVERITSYHPRTKRVEGVFNKLWTLLGNMPGHVGRSRGEDKIATEMLMRARRGTIDARATFLSIEEATRRVVAACQAANAEPVESRVYGRWVPAERWAAESPKHLRALPAGELDWVARSERKILTVRRDGTVRPSVTDEWGISHPFAFGWDEGWKHAGAEVVCYFSGEPARAAAEGCRVMSRDGKTLLTARADALCDALSASVLRKAQSQSVRSEHRALRPDGKLQAWASETRGPEGTERTAVAQSLGRDAQGGTRDGCAPRTDGGRSDGGRADGGRTDAGRMEALPAPRRHSLSEADIEAAFAEAALGL
jgi:hypothetical protein